MKPTHISSHGHGGTQPYRSYQQSLAEVIYGHHLLLIPEYPENLEKYPENLEYWEKPENPEYQENPEYPEKPEYPEYLEYPEKQELIS